MCFSSTLVISLFIFIKISADAETRESSMNIVESPASVDFHDIFSSHLSMLSDDKPQIQAKELHLLSSPLVEFRFPKVETSTGIPLSTLPARYAISIAHQKKLNETASSTTNSSPVPSYNSTPNYSSTIHSIMKVTGDKTVKVVLIKDDNQQRGVLDLLFPSSRVKAFKNVFDSLKMILSNTFRKR